MPVTYPVDYRDTDTLHIVHERSLAAELIQRGLRLAAVGSLLPELPTSVISRLWKEIHGTPPMSGRLPMGVASVLRSHRQAALASAMMVEYLALAHQPKKAIDLDALCVAWDGFRDSLQCAYAPAERDQQAESICNINTLWLIARGYKSNAVHLRECKKCRASHIVCDRWSMRRFLICPHCEIARQQRCKK